MSTYGAFAEVYDHLMDDFDYPAWADYYLELIRRSGIEPKRICDCACGTGSISIPLALRGLRVTGVDISTEMLERAGEKARRSGVQVMFARQDMCALQLPRPVDALICACDGVNYLLTEERLMAFFQRAKESVRPGGVLAFDISSSYKLKHILGDNFFGEERDEVAYLWSNRFDPVHKCVNMDLTFFLRESNGLYRRFIENHKQRAHEADELMSLLHTCGFENIQIYGDQTWEAPKSDEKRIHFVATRS